MSLISDKTEKDLCDYHFYAFLKFLWFDCFLVVYVYLYIYISLTQVFCIWERLIAALWENNFGK